MSEFCDKPQIPGPADVPCGLDKGHRGFCQPDYKHRRKSPAPPEPREPAAREAVEAEAMKFIIERGWEDDNYGVSRVAAEFALAYSAELRAERDLWNQCAYQNSVAFIAVEAEAAELKASLLQAREALLKYGQHESGCASRIWCDEHVQFEDSKLPCDCGWASTSAPEGTV